MRSRAVLAGLMLVLPQLASAQGTRVSGIVYDSLAHVPLRGATVQLVPAVAGVQFSGAAVSDTLGRYIIDSVPDGKYMLGFFHPMLDSLAVAPPLREITVNGRGMAHADIAIPSATRLRTAICGKGAATDSAGIVVGVVRDARGGAPVNGASVQGQWLELALARGAMSRQSRSLVATTGDNGWFALCNVPRAGMLWLMASRGSDSTAQVDVTMAADGFARHELYLGGPHLALTGTVTALPEGRPIANARVSITNGAQVRTNERGEFTLADVPAGTRRLDVRAIGFYPDLRSVDVVEGAAPVRIAMATMKSVLDTIRVTASAARRDLIGFEERQRSGAGKYLTAEAIDRFRPVVTSDVFRLVPGMRKIGDSISMRGLFAQDPNRPGDPRCGPAVYVDGVRLPGAPDGTTGTVPMATDSQDIDDWVAPADIKGIEVYMPGTAPAEYSMAFQGCGVILIWTRRR